MNVSSLAGTNALPGLAPYSTSKAGLSHFTAALPAECKGTGITTTLAEIGPVESDDDARACTATRPPSGRSAGSAACGLAVELDMDSVVAALVDGIEHQRRHVRHAEEKCALSDPDRDPTANDRAAAHGSARPGLTGGQPE